MIVSDLAHLPTQLKTNTAFDQAIEFLRQEQWRDKPDGKIVIDGDAVFALLQSYTTHLPENTVKYEGHRKYIDIQYVVEGKETIYWRHAPELTPTTPYDPATDVGLVTRQRWMQSPSRFCPVNSSCCFQLTRTRQHIALATPFTFARS